MVQKINESLMQNSGKLVEIKGVVIHNDSGSMTPQQYIHWLRHRNKELGIAHYYINRDCIARVVDTYNIAYHTGDWSSNQRYIGYEVCQSLSASDQDFLANEDMTLMQATEDLLFYKLPINEHTVRLHHEFVPTSCPHRSMKLHGNSTASVKNYFIERMKYFASIGKTVDEMLVNKNKQVLETKQSPQPQVGLKPIEEVAQEVINGKWGNGKARIQNLTQAGYDAQSVQERVDVLLGKSAKQTTSKPKIFTMVAERGKFTVTNGPILVKNEPYVKAPKVAKYENGESMNYDHYTICDGHVWVSYISGSGIRRYVPIGEHNGHKRTSLWGTIQ